MKAWGVACRGIKVSPDMTERETGWKRESNRFGMGGKTGNIGVIGGDWWVKNEITNWTVAFHLLAPPLVPSNYPLCVCVCVCLLVLYFVRLHKIRGFRCLLICVVRPVYIFLSPAFTSAGSQVQKMFQRLGTIWDNNQVTIIQTPWVRSILGLL